MDANELAKKMIAWGDAKRSLDTLEGEIAQAVLQLGKTQTVGNVRATFSTGRKTYDYQASARSLLGMGDLSDNQSVQEATSSIVDWHMVCDAIGISHDDIIFKSSAPAVTLKLL